MEQNRIHVSFYWYPPTFTCDDISWSAKTGYRVAEISDSDCIKRQGRHASHWRWQVPVKDYFRQNTESTCWDDCKLGWIIAHSGIVGGNSQNQCGSDPMIRDFIHVVDRNNDNKNDGGVITDKSGKPKFNQSFLKNGLFRSVACSNIMGGGVLDPISGHRAVRLHQYIIFSPPPLITKPYVILLPPENDCQGSCPPLLHHRNVKNCPHTNVLVHTVVKTGYVLPKYP